MRYNAELQNLDTLLYGRETQILHPFDTAVSWGISAWTWHRRVHAGFVLKAQGRTLVVDASAGGIDVRPLSADLANGRNICVRRGPSALTYMREEMFRDDVWALWGTGKYGFRKCGRNILSEILGTLSNKEGGAIPRTAFCSELVSAFQRKHGLFDPCPQFVDRYTTPADLAKSRVLTTMVDRLAFAQ